MTPPLEGAHNLRALLRSGDAVMSGGKIIPIIAAANRAQSAELKAVINSDIAALIDALDDMLMPIEMWERYTPDQPFATYIERRARYANYRRFTVSTSDAPSGK